MIPQVCPAQFSVWMESVKGYGKPVVLDVREPSELKIASIKADGFELVTLPMGVVALRLAELNASRPTACLCHHGARSLRIATFLNEHGFDCVINVAGGINAWSIEMDGSVPRY